MSRKRLTQLFPFLLPIRKTQKKLCFYLKMRFDGEKYASEQVQERLPYPVFQSRCPMYNTQTGFPMCYQENKVHNLKIASRKLDGLMIKPEETFSFFNRIRYADREIPYRDALSEIDGKLVTEYGGGLCQITNLLCWLFLHSPLTITERHGHNKKDFPEPPSDAPLGVDATVAEGWLDFRVKNNTANTYQLQISFDHDAIIGTLFTDSPPSETFLVANRNLVYRRSGQKIFEEVDIIQQVADLKTGEVHLERKAYRNQCEITYQLPDGIEII